MMKRIVALPVVLAAVLTTGGCRGKEQSPAALVHEVPTGFVCVEFAQLTSFHAAWTEMAARGLRAPTAQETRVFGELGLGSRCLPRDNIMGAVSAPCMNGVREVLVLMDDLGRDYEIETYQVPTTMGLSSPVAHRFLALHDK